jgi:putative transposase
MQSPITWYGYRAIEKKGLVGPVEARWKALLVEIATQYGLEKLAVEGMPDHGHRLVSAPPKFAAAEMVCLFQGITSRRWKKEFESLHRPYVEEHATLWAEGYY